MKRLIPTNIDPDDFKSSLTLDEIGIVNDRLMRLTAKMDNLIPHKRANILGVYGTHLDVLDTAIETLVTAVMALDVNFATVVSSLIIIEEYYTLISKPS